MRANACVYTRVNGPTWLTGCSGAPAFQDLPTAYRVIAFHVSPIADGWAYCPFCGGWMEESGDLGPLKK